MQFLLDSWKIPILDKECFAFLKLTPCMSWLVFSYASLEKVLGLKFWFLQSTQIC